METKQAVQALSALAQDSRLSIFKLLVQAGPTGMAAGSIGERLQMPPATLSFHLAALTRADLAVSRQDGRFVIYSANFQNMVQLVAYLTENCCCAEYCAPDACQPQPAKGEHHETAPRARRRA